MAKICSVLATQCSELGGVRWEWKAADGRMGEARFGGDKIGRNPTDRGKPGTKVSILTDRMGGPLGDDGIFIDLGDQLAGMLGHNRQELIGQEISQVVAPETREHSRQAIHTGKPQPCEHLTLRNIQVSAIRGISERKH